MFNKKYLIASGCSFTEGHILKEKGSWATYFAKNNNLTLVNLGKGGAGNEYIINNTIQYSIMNKEIADNAIFGIQLSEVLRTLVCLDFPDTNGYPKYTHLTPMSFIDEQHFDNWNFNVYHNNFIYENRYSLAPFFINITHAVSITINSLINFINFCEKNNYQYFIFDGINTNIPEKTKNGWGLIGKAEIDNHKVEVMENLQTFGEFKNNGRPIIHKSIIEYLLNIKNYIRDVQYKQYLIDIGDNEYNDSNFYLKDNVGHPNELGSKLWAEHLQPIIEDLFGKIN